MQLLQGGQDHVRRRLPPDARPLPDADRHHPGKVQLSQLLDWLGDKFDFVLVDAPPVGMIIDAAEVAKSCDGVLFVINYNTISRREMLEAKQQIERTGCKILGAVLNNVSFDSYSSKKYYYKSYYNTHYESDYYQHTPSKSGSKGAAKSGTRSAGSAKKAR